MRPSRALLRLQVIFPGPVTQSDGQVSGGTVTWRPQLGQRLVVGAVAEDSPGPRAGCFRPF